MIVQKNGPVLVTAASSDPVTTAEARAYCRIDGTADDAALALLIPVATEYVQERCGQQLIQATLLETWDCWPCEFELDRYPVVSVSTVKYYDADGTLTTISSSNYHVDTYSRPPRIVPVSSYTWPEHQDGRPSAIEVTYVAGYSSSATVPAKIKTAIKALVYHLFNLPGPVLTTGAVPQQLPYHLESLIEMARIGYQ